MSPVSTQTRVVVYYAVWAALCAAVAGAVAALVHLIFFNTVPQRSIWLHDVFGWTVTTLAVAAGQGVVTLLTGRLLLRLGRTLRYTVLLGLLIGAFDFALALVQMFVPAADVGWTPTLLILAAAAAGITVLGQAAAGAAEASGGTSSELR